MDIHIRGALGTQIFDLVFGLIRQRQIHKIYINTGGKVVPTVKQDWISQIFDLDVPVELLDRRSKQSVWSDPQRVREISLCDASSLLNLKRANQRNHLEILHVRGLDRQLVSIQHYTKLLEQLGSNVRVIGDDGALIETIISQVGFGHYVPQDPVSDWYTCLGADAIYGGFTNFTLSVMLFDPDKKFRMLSSNAHQGPASINKSVWIGVQHLFDNYFSNSDWIDL